MTEGARPLVVGIGSSHADDQAGWLLIEQLSSRNQLASQNQAPRKTQLPTQDPSPSPTPGHAQLRKAAVPHDLMDWVDPCGVLHIVDACDTGDAILRIELTDQTSLESIDKLTRNQSSHQFGLGKVIELGRLLGQLPDCIVVWAIPGENFDPSQGISERCQQHVKRCAELLAKELEHA